LLVLDNVEQVLSAAPEVAALLTACPQLKAMATSRTRLRVRGERELRVPPLDLPDPKRLPPVEDLGEVAAVRLFAERAGAVTPYFALSEANALAVAAICIRLEGLPLAIELAASRSSVLPPQALLSRLEKRLGLLTGGPRDAPARQQTLRDAIAWSHDLLTPAEQALFTRLAVFSGGCTLEAVEVVCNEAGDLGADVLEGITALVDSSLVRQEEHGDGGPDAGTPRFTMLETIREYAMERLAASGEEELLRLTHADYFLALAERAEPALEGPEQGQWLERLETEHGNLRVALGLLLETSGEAEHGQRLAGALWRFWWVRGHLTEGREWLKQALARPGAASPAVRAKALDGEAVLAGEQGDYEHAVALSEEALALQREAGDKHGIARSLYNLGTVATHQGDYDRAEHRFNEGLTLLRGIGHRRGVGIGLTSLGLLAFIRADYPRAISLNEESLILWQELGDRQSTAVARATLGEAWQHQGDYARAAALYDEALALYRALGDKQGMARALYNLGTLALAQGDDTQAAMYLVESLSVFHQLEDSPATAECLEALAGVAVARGHAEQASRLFGVAEALREAISYPIQAAYRVDYDRHVAAAQAELGGASFAAAWAAGRATSLRQIIAAALEPEGCASKNTDS
jgi:predicted ATPase/Tfp pilus assembly protein PilF